MARKETARKASSEETAPVYGEPGFAPMQEPNELTAILHNTELGLARAEERAEQAPVSTEQATQQLVDTLPLQLSPAEYEAKRFEAFKLDLYRVLYKHKYVLTSNPMAIPGRGEPGIHVVDAGNTSRMKRQLAQAGCVESLVNLTGKVEL